MAKKIITVQSLIEYEGIYTLQFTAEPGIEIGVGVELEIEIPETNDEAGDN